nr:MAG: nonstructural protein [Microviridae sp.]
MPILKLFAIRDNKVGAYCKPFVESNAIQASRALHQAVNDPLVQLSQFPEDFDLYELAEIDDQTGNVTEKGSPIFVVSAVSLKLSKKEKVNGDDKTN